MLEPTISEAVVLSPASTDSYLVVTTPSRRDRGARALARQSGVRPTELVEASLARNCYRRGISTGPLRLESMVFGDAEVQSEAPGAYGRAVVASTAAEQQALPPALATGKRVRNERDLRGRGSVASVAVDAARDALSPSRPPLLIIGAARPRS